MADTRELILARLRELGKIRGVATVARNAMQISDGDALPAVILYDGDEEVKADPSGRPALSIQRVTMTPWFQITLQADHEQVGEDLNTLRLRLISAVLQDAELLALTAEGRGVHYAGGLTKFAAARSTQGDMACRFSILYYLRPSDL